MVRSLTPRLCLLVPALLSLAALAGALISQYGFDYHPCELCLYQRWPYAIIVALGLLALPFVKGPAPARMLLLVMALLFVIDAGIAAYHTGVEWDIFEGLDACSAGELPPGASLEDVRRQLMEAPVVSCKDAMFVFLGLSMAAWNVLYALGGAGLSLFLCRHLYRQETQDAA